jgi:hypothetical protein
MVQFITADRNNRQTENDDCARGRAVLGCPKVILAPAD